MEEVKVVVMTVAITENYEVLKGAISDDPFLTQMTLLVKEELDAKGIETFKVDRNCLITEEGYQFVYLFEE